jgi:WhiB family redox-sensing transcriptional regulator
MISGWRNARREKRSSLEVTMAELSRLPGPMATAYDWQFQGSCRDVDPALFFHPDGERGPSRRHRDAEAVAICAGCPVLEACRRHGLGVREPYGVWGGLTEEERAAILGLERQERQVAASAPELAEAS